MPYRDPEAAREAKRRYYARKGRETRRRAYLAQKAERPMQITPKPLAQAVANWRTQ